MATSTRFAVTPLQIAGSGACREEAFGESRPLSTTQVRNRTIGWIPAFAGMTERLRSILMGMTDLCSRLRGDDRSRTQVANLRYRNETAYTPYTRGNDEPLFPPSWE